ncbi:hypothetical protein D9756_003035 [Leucocoprinus leucothites]|uniref:DUF4604 domain-containing protein n=1 Tax=Leucocoprinus leucothites TaxID=201217 RepID=A0A8H5G6J4_9AGAR|nr:hypothetical protein D9756_003035 [Leucoagaricus leucothites]
MAPKELSRHQLSSKLAYQAHVPAFLQKLQNRMAGVPDEPSDEDEPQYEDDEFEYVGGGRPPIPRRPPIPKRPASQPGSGDEEVDDRDEEGDEKPQIVVLREGKHLSEREVENIKRKEKGLPPLPEATESAQEGNDAPASSEKSKDDVKSSSSKSQGLSFSSGKTTTKVSTKRKALSQPDSDSENDLARKMGIGKAKSTSGGKDREKSKEKPKKKPKKESKKLLSFGDDA